MQQRLRRDPCFRVSQDDGAYVKTYSSMYRTEPMFRSGTQKVVKGGRGNVELGCFLTEVAATSMTCKRSMGSPKCPRLPKDNIFTLNLAI